MKLYKFTGTYVHPQSGFGNAPVWHGSNGEVTYATMDDTCLASFNAAQDADWVICTTDDVAWVKANSEAYARIKARIPRAIRAKYTIDDEFMAHRTADQTVLSDIAAIVSEHTAQADALVAIA